MDDLFPDDPSLDHLKALADAHNRPFSEQAIIAGLDPAFELQHADLREIDLTGSDLRGFNLANADLTAAWGKRVTWDATTNLKGATIDGSIFALREGQRRYFEGNPHATDRLKRLRRQSDSDKINWAADNLRHGASGRESNVPLVQALYLEADGAFLKSQLFYFMSPALSPQELKDFALGLIAEEPDSAAIMRSLISVLNLHNLTADRQLRRAIIGLLTSANFDVRDSALRWLARHGVSDEEFELIKPFLLEDDRLAGVYVAAVAKRYGEVHEIAVRDPMTNNVFGINVRVPMSSLLRIAVRWGEAERSNAPGRLVERLYLRERQIRSDNLRRERANAILRHWTDLRNDHIHIWLAGHHDN